MDTTFTVEISPVERYALICVIEVALNENKFGYDRARVLKALFNSLVGESYDDWRKENDE